MCVKDKIYYDFILIISIQLKNREISLNLLNLTFASLCILLKIPIFTNTNKIIHFLFFIYTQYSNNNITSNGMIAENSLRNFLQLLKIYLQLSIYIPLDMSGQITVV